MNRYRTMMIALLQAVCPKNITDMDLWCINIEKELFNRYTGIRYRNEVISLVRKLRSNEEFLNQIDFNKINNFTLDKLLLIIS